MTGPDRRDLGRVFDEVPQLYDRVRSAYPDELFADLVAITGMDRRSPVLEVGCGTGQATRSLAALRCPVTAIEPGAGMAAVAPAARRFPRRRGREFDVRGVGRRRTALRCPGRRIGVALGRPVHRLAPGA
jgi:SAM-dependent methyltransferase